MELSIVRRAVNWVFASGLAADPLTILWHAGEPLTLAPAWYESAIAEAVMGAAPAARLLHRLQTNATLINDRWCALFLTHNVRVGVSLDGPAWLHDACRRSRNGRGTHAMTMRGVHALQRHGIPLDVICVVTRDTLRVPDQLADFFLAEGIDQIGFNIEEIEGNNTVSSLDYEGAREEFARFLHRFIDRADESGRLRLREVEGMLNWLRNPQFGNARGNEQNTPFEIVTVTHCGDLATFSPELVGLKTHRYGNYVIGNVGNTSLDQILVSERFQALHHEIEYGVMACAAKCSYFQLCRGGAPSNKISEHGSFNVTETLCCKLADQTVADVVLSHLEARLNVA